MPETKEATSMFETVKLHGETLDDHGNRITKLEEADKEKADSIALLTREFADISTNFTRMENTILKSAQTTQEVMSTQNTQQWELIKALNAGNQEERVRKHELTKTKLEKFWEYAGKITALLLGSGSILYILLEQLNK